MKQNLADDYHDVDDDVDDDDNDERRWWTMTTTTKMIMMTTKTTIVKDTVALRLRYDPQLEQVVVPFQPAPSFLENETPADSFPKDWNPRVQNRDPGQFRVTVKR